jgi:heterodisulfide reductase subunit B
MKYVYFPGCKIPYYLPQYDEATRAVMNLLEVELIDIELNCCGYPIRHSRIEASVYSSARILAIAEQRNLPLLTPCKCCYGNLKYAAYCLEENAVLRGRINELLHEEDLAWHGITEIRHLLSVFSEDVGIKELAGRIVRSFQSLNVAVHYGCHALRPADVVDFDNPFAPARFEKLVALTGATPVEWPLKLECCGAPIWEKNRSLALELLSKKRASARHAGADIICTACTYCQNQFDRVPDDAANENRMDMLPSVLYPQLLGLAMGLDRTLLGLEKNRIIWSPSV